MSKYLLLGETIRFITHHPRVVHTLLELGAKEIARDLIDNQLMKPILNKQNKIIDYKGIRQTNVIWQLELPANLLDKAKQALLDAGFIPEEAK